MDKRFQVFVSSTFADLRDERRAVMQALLSLDHFPAGMELFPASDEDQWALIRGVIDDSDYYVVVIGARYGSLSAEGISYTEKEFDYAAQTSAPILAFLHEAPDALPARDSDQNDELREKLNEFRDKIQTDRHVKFWRSADDLQAKVIQAVSAETKRNPRIGWVRADRASDPRRLNELLKENERLKVEISNARLLPPPGAEKFAGGNDEFEINFTTKDSWASDEDWHATKLTWGRIFYEIGPLIIKEASDREVRRLFSRELPRYENELADKNFYSCEIQLDDWHTIKVQLMALGLMRKSDCRKPPSDTKTYWSITPYGEEYLTRLRAIRRSTA